MTLGDIVLGLLFLFQTGFGILGNSFLLGLYIIVFFSGEKLRPIDLIFMHLAFVNDLVLLFKGIPQTMATFGFYNFLDDIGCKLVFYFHRVARDLTLSTTCLLSSFQAIALSPSTSRWAQLKARAPGFIVFFCLFSWTVHLLSNYILLLCMKGQNERKNVTNIVDLVYCSVEFCTSFSSSKHKFRVSISDTVCIGVMISASGYVLLILYRHHHRVGYIHDNHLTPINSPEIRAKQTILLVVGMFVSFYSLNSILIFLMSFKKPSSPVVHITAFLTACFPAFIPFILLVSDSQVSKYYLALWGKIKEPS